MGFCAFSEDSGGILCIFGSSSWDFVHFWKFFVRFCAFFEFHMGFCAFLEVSRGIFYIFGSSSKSNEDLPKMRKISGETSKYAQNPTRIFRKCTRFHD
jgi:hypothetical protein